MRSARRACASFLFLSCLTSPLAAQEYDPDMLGTFSIIARDPATGELGMAVQSKAFGAGNRAVTIKGGVAVVAHQPPPPEAHQRVLGELLRLGAVAGQQEPEAPQPPILSGEELAELPPGLGHPASTSGASTPRHR